MLDIFGRVASWLLLAFLGAHVFACAGLALWCVWNDAIKPLLIPRAEIEREAQAIIAGHRDPEMETIARYKRAGHRCESGEQRRWLRVRKAVRHTLQHRKRGIVSNIIDDSLKGA